MRGFQYPHGNAITRNKHIALLSPMIQFIEILQHAHAGFFEKLKDRIDKYAGYSDWIDLSTRIKLAREQLKMKFIFLRDCKDLKYLTLRLPSNHYVFKVSLTNWEYAYLFKIHEEDAEDNSTSLSSIRDYNGRVTRI